MTAALWTMIGKPSATVQFDNFVTKQAFALQGVLFHVALAVVHENHYTRIEFIRKAIRRLDVGLDDEFCRCCIAICEIVLRVTKHRPGLILRHDGPTSWIFIKQIMNPEGIPRFVSQLNPLLVFPIDVDHFEKP